MIKMITDKESLLAFVDDYENLGIIKFGCNVLSLPFLTVESVTENNGTYTINYRVYFNHQEHDIQLDLCELSSGDFFIKFKTIFYANTNIHRRHDLFPYRVNYDYKEKNIISIEYNRNDTYSSSVHFADNLIYLNYNDNYNDMNTKKFSVDLIIVDKKTKKIEDIEMSTHFYKPSKYYYLSIMRNDYPELSFFWDIEVDDPINFTLDDTAIKDKLMIVESLLI